MSNADEILKLKELLDSNVITKEEFNKKKSELLNQCTSQNMNSTSKVSNKQVKEKKKMSVGKIILIVLFALFIFGNIVLNTIKTDPNAIKLKGNSAIRNTLMNDYGLSKDEATNVANILYDCDITDYSITDVTDVSISLATKYDFEYSNYFPNTLDNVKVFNLITFSSNGSVILKLVLQNNMVYSVAMDTISNNGVTINFDEFETGNRFFYKDGTVVQKVSNDLFNKWIQKYNIQQVTRR